MHQERRIEWRLTADPPPEGWRRGGQWLKDDGTLDVLYTNAPSNANPYEHEFVFTNYTSFRQVRDVSEWRDVTS